MDSPGTTPSAWPCPGVFAALLNDDWLVDSRDYRRTLALQLVQPWARFCLERNGVTGHFAEEVLAWAERATREPAAFGGDLGDNLNQDHRHHSGGTSHRRRVTIHRCDILIV